MGSVDVGGFVRDDGDDEHLTLPGFVNAHSHAFQRALRGRVEMKSAEHPNDSFWAWRTAMYRDAARVTVDDVGVLAAWCYSDMLRAGYTHVGEFHYLHHDVGAKPFATRPEMSLAIAAAAARVGIRLTLLETAYARGGAQKPLSDEQKRFAFPTADAYLKHVDAVRGALKGAPGEPRVGCAIHSVRACPREWITDVARYAVDNALPLHVHACEQQKELEECRWEHGMSPIALLAACGALTPGVTIVHGTHVDDDDIALLRERGAMVCLTPSTERNLGDGLCPIEKLKAADIRLCVGSDSHARIDVVDELRSLEDHERLRTEKRNVLVDPGQRLAHALIPAGTWCGSQSLFAAQPPDRVIVKMPIEGRAGDAAAGLDAWLVGGSSRDVVDVFVDEEKVVDGGVVVRAPEIEREVIAVLKRLAAVD